MKYLLFILLFFTLSCTEHHNKWVLNIHPGIVINDDNPLYGYQVTVLDSGNIYHCNIDRDMWRYIYIGDTIVNFNNPPLRSYQLQLTQSRIYLYDGNRLVDSLTPGNDSLTYIINKDNL